MWLYPKVKKFEDMFSHLDRMPACDRRRDGQTDILRQHSRRYAQHRALGLNNFAACTSGSRVNIESKSNVSLIESSWLLYKRPRTQHLGYVCRYIIAEVQQSSSLINRSLDVGHMSCHSVFRLKGQLKATLGTAAISERSLPVSLLRITVINVAKNILLIFVLL